MTVTRITTTVKPAASRPLTTIALFKSMINKTETDQDTYLGWAVNSASVAAEQYCNRIFTQELLSDAFRIRRDLVASASEDRLILSRRPVTNVWAVVDYTSVATTLASSMTNNQTTLPCVDALPITYPFNVLVDTGVNSEVMTVTGLVSGKTYTVTRNVNGLGNGSTGVAHAVGVAVNTALDPSLYEFDPATGFLTRFSDIGHPILWRPGLVTVNFTAGYIFAADSTRTLPYDIEDAVIRYLKYQWFTRDRDPTVRSTGEPGVGNQMFWVGPPSENSNWPADAAAILDNYRDVKFGAA